MTPKRKTAAEQWFPAAVRHRLRRLLEEVLVVLVQMVGWLGRWLVRLRRGRAKSAIVMMRMIRMIGERIAGSVMLLS